MSRIGVCVLAVMAFAMAGAAPAVGQEHEACRYSLLHNGPTWDSQTMRIPWDVVVNVWARDGAYGGGGLSTGTALRRGGAGVASAAVSYWFRLTHDAVPGCQPVQFDSSATLSADVSTSIDGDKSDYALATGFQAVSGHALQPVSLAVAATNAGSPVQGSTISVSVGNVGFSVSIPGVSVTTDTVDQDRNTVSTFGLKQVEVEQIAVHCWVKIKVVTNGPFGGLASASVEKTGAVAATTSTCHVHAQTGSFTHDVSEG